MTYIPPRPRTWFESRADEASVLLSSNNLSEHRDECTNANNWTQVIIDTTETGTCGCLTTTTGTRGVGISPIIKGDVAWYWAAHFRVDTAGFTGSDYGLVGIISGAGTTSYQLGFSRGGSTTKFSFDVGGSTGAVVAASTINVDTSWHNAIMYSTGVLGNMFFKIDSETFINVPQTSLSTATFFTSLMTSENNTCTKLDSFVAYRTKTA